MIDQRQNNRNHSLGWIYVLHTGSLSISSHPRNEDKQEDIEPPHNPKPKARPLRVHNGEQDSKQRRVYNRAQLFVRKTARSDLREEGAAHVQQMWLGGSAQDLGSVWCDLQVEKPCSSEFLPKVIHCHVPKSVCSSRIGQNNECWLLTPWTLCWHAFGLAWPVRTRPRCPVRTRPRCSSPDVQIRPVA